MGFTQEKLPPIFEYIIQKIEENDGKINTNEFKEILYHLRIEKKDIKEIKQWLKHNGYIEIINRRPHEDTIQLIEPDFK